MIKPISTSNLVGKSKRDGKAPFLRLLREKKQVSRMELSKITRLSTYQVEGLEGKNAQNLLSKIFICIKALGYQADDIFKLLESLNGPEEDVMIRGALGKHRSESNCSDGVSLMTYHECGRQFFGELKLGAGRAVKSRQLPRDGILLGIVREGTLVIDASVNQSVHKKDHFFIIPENTTFEISNSDCYAKASTLLFLSKIPSVNS